jgi:hypothetical protein
MCDLTTGFAVGCIESVGGVAEVLFANMPTDFAVTQDATGEVDTMTGTGLAFYKYECTKAQGAASSFNDNPTVNAQNGTSFFDQTATFVLNKMEQTKRNEVKMLARAKLSVVVKDNNGTYWLLGQKNGIRLVSGEAGTGTAIADRNGYSLSFQGQEPEPIAKVTASVIIALIS